jgi:Flp pilus assembly protein TadG
MSHATRKRKLSFGALRTDCSGLALMEFGFTLPIILMVGGYGIELSNLAVAHLRISQYALNLADNASRVGVSASGGVTQLRESDINDVLQGARLEAGAINIGTTGRVILSSLENVQQSYDTTTVQRLHWQRCFGTQKGTNFDSHYGTTTTTAGSDATKANAGKAMPNGMGMAGSMVNAPANSGVMFVEINYQYKPLFGTMFVSPQVIRYSASLIVRDNRDFSQIYPATGVTASTCDLYNS